MEELYLGGRMSTFEEGYAFIEMYQYSGLCSLEEQFNLVFFAARRV